MRSRIAYSMNVKNTPLAKARAYAEQEFQAAGQDLDKVLPNFDKNYKDLQGALSSALDVPRIQMPVIEPSDMALFNKRLNEGAVDIFPPYAKGKFYAPQRLSKKEGEEWVELGFQDGEGGDDRVKGKVTNVAVGKLKPTQSQIWFDKIIPLIVKYGPASSGSPILKATVIVSGDNYILDGHHRYAQAMMSNQGLAMRGLKVPLRIKQLLQIGKTYGEAIGNKPKASINNRIARELVKIARELLD